MRATTKHIHNRVSALGRQLGFDPTREVSGTVLSLRLDEAYLPCADVLWSLKLSEPQADALAAVTGADATRLRHLPIVGIEIEGTTPTTKTMGADIANIAALGTRVGLLIVSEAGERGIYRRAARTVRTLRRSFGDLQVIPMDASWLDALERRSWSKTPSTISKTTSRAPAGGETLDWSASTRTYLRELGRRAGFVIAEPYTPELLEIAFEEENKRRAKPLTHLTDPVKRTTSRMKTSGDFLTACQVDLAWLLPLPKALTELMSVISEKDPHLREHGVLHPDLFGHVAVVGFELESSSGKHAAGGLLNLAAYCVIGVGVSPSRERGDELSNIIARYRPTLGLRNVRVLVHA